MEEERKSYKALAQEYSSKRELKLKCSEEISSQTQKKDQNTSVARVSEQEKEKQKMT